MSTSLMWDSVAPAWERNATIVDDHTASATALMLERAEIRPGYDVLDLAAGPGGAGLAAASIVGPGGTVVLTDVAPAMVEIARRRSAALAFVQAHVSDLAAIEAPDGSFDAVLCRHGLMLAAEPTAAVREITRVLRPGGRMAAATWGAREANPWLGLVLDAVGEQFGVPFPPAGVAGPFALSDPHGLAAVLEAGGLEGIRVERVATTMHAASLELWWRQVPELAGPLAQALEAMEPEVRTAIQERALASATVAASVTADGIRLDGEILFASGHAPGRTAGSSVAS